MKSNPFQKTAVIALVTIAGLCATAAAHAQTRPAYTKNVDEPGRMPYEVDVEFTATACGVNCTNFSSYLPNGSAATLVTFDAPSVPAGKRLVLQWVSALLSSGNATTAVIGLQTQPNSTFSKMKWIFPGPFYSFGGGLGMSSALFTTVEPGDAPHLTVTYVAPTAVVTRLTLSGYLIDATN